MKRVLVGLCVVLLAAVAASGAAAAPRPVLVGFEDEPSFLWAPNKVARIASAAEDGTSVIRIIANWSQLSPRAGTYRFSEFDDTIFNAQQRGMRVLLTVWGTPKWASASHKPNAAPKPATLGAFCSVLAKRYNGRSGHPPVTLYSVWNEPNLNQFLAPQYDKKGRDVAPRLYAGMARACYAAIKKANPAAQVAIGETSPRGVDRVRKTTIQASHSPGRFAQLVAAVKPRVKFDAWAHHPYGQGFTGRATVPFRWPNVGVADLPRLEAKLKSWFRLRTVPLWITEFAYQTSPERARALSYSQQASYLRDAFLKTVAVPQVQMFIWFVYRDTPGERWQSGIIRADSTPKPAQATWRETVAPYSVDNPTLYVRRSAAIVLPLPLVTLQANRLPSDPPLGLTYRVFDPAGNLFVGAQTTGVPDLTGTAKFTLKDFKPTAPGAYRVELAANDIHGTVIYRKATIVVR